MLVLCLRAMGSPPVGCPLVVIGKSGKAAVLWHGGHVQDRKTSPYISPGVRIWGRLGWVVYLPGVFMPHMLRLRHCQVWRAWSRPHERRTVSTPRFPQLAWLLTQEQGVLWILLPSTSLRDGGCGTSFGQKVS